MNFIKERNKRIDNYANQQTTEQNASQLTRVLRQAG